MSGTGQGQTPMYTGGSQGFYGGKLGADSAQINPGKMPVLYAQGSQAPQQPAAPTDGSRFGFGPYGVQDGQTGEFMGGPRNRRFGTPPPYQDPQRFTQKPFGVQDGQTGEFYGGPRNRRFGPPPPYQGFGPQGFTGNEWQGGNPSMDVIHPQIPQTDAGVSVNYNPSGGGLLASSQAAPQTQAPQGQTLEQFTASLGNAGQYTPGQISDMYAKQSQPTNFWANTGVGTQQPNGFTTPANWGQQTYGFDPRAQAGKKVGNDMGWFYGRDAIGRTINNQGDAVAGFSSAADGFNRSRPWF